MDLERNLEFVNLMLKATNDEEQKLMDIISTLPFDKKGSLSLAEVNDIRLSNHEEEFKPEILLNLYKKKIVTKDKTFTHLIDEVSRADKTTARFRISRYLKNNLKNFDTGITNTPIEDLGKLSSSYTKKLYLLFLCENDYVIFDPESVKRPTKLIIAPKLLMELMDSPKAYSFSLFNANILGKAVLELQENFPTLDLRCRAIRNTVKVRKVVISHA